MINNTTTGAAKRLSRIMLMILITACVITSAAGPAFAAGEGMNIRSITWRIKGYTDLAGLGYTLREITAVNGIDVNSTSDMNSSYAFCVEPILLGPEGEDAEEGQTYTAGDKTAGGGGEKIYTFNGDEAAEEGYKMMRKLCYYLPSGYGWTKVTSKWYRAYRDNLGDDADNYDLRSGYALGATVLAKQWAKDADNPEGNANYGYSKINDDARALVDRFLTEVRTLPDPPAEYIAFYVQKDNFQDIWGSLYAAEYGSVKVQKGTAVSQITSGNNSYGLEGAEFTIYTDSGCSTRAKLKNGNAAIIKTKADGSSEAVEIETGDYYIRETKAPKGYAADTKAYPLTISRGTTYTYSCKDEPITDLVQILMTKNPDNYPFDHGEGDATLKGAVYEFRYYDGQYDTAAKAEASGKPTATWNLVTDANGKINGQNPVTASGTTNSPFYKDKDGKTAYPLGTYVIREVKAPEGYLVNDEKLVVHITEDGTDNPHVKTYNESVKGNDTIIRGGVKLSKIDNDLDENYAQGEATLQDAEFTVYNQSKESIMVDGKEIAKGDAALVIKTNEEGEASSDAHALPYGSYLVRETKPSKGYLLNNEWSGAFTIREDGKIVDLTEDKVREAVIRGGVQIIKRDKELKKSEALGGARLDNIVMTIKNVSGRDVVVRKELNNKTDKIDWKKIGSKKDLFESEAIKRVPTGKDVGKITVHWNEEKKAYTAETLPDDLPYGTYTIRESKTNETYQRTDKKEHIFTIREDGVIVSFDDGSNEMALTFDDYVYRSDVQGTKIADSSSERFSFVPFKIISVTNGETHVVVTDRNGLFSTRDRRTDGDLDEDEDADTARKQNPFDDLLEAKVIKTADLEKRPQDILCGVWFGTGETGDKAEMNSKFGALPYDSYILEEMPCEHNEGYILQKFYFTVDQKSQNGFVDLETITDDVPEIGTTASVEGKNRNIRPKKEITLVDVIEYKNLKKGETYTAKGVLIDKATGKPALDSRGKQITAEQEFKTILSSGRVKVTFTFDATSLYGKDTVVFEKVFDSEGHIAAKHEDLDDKDQTVTWEKLSPKYEMYKIRTTKAPSKGDKYGFFAQDEVEYEVHIENTGNVEITMDVTDNFTQSPDYFTVPVLKDVKFTGKGTWNNKGKDDKTANISLNTGEQATVTYAAVVKDEAREYLAARAKDSDSLDEKNHDTNMAYQMNIPDDKDGYRNTAECVNVTYPNPQKPEEPGKLEPKKDVAQTPVQRPSIGTSLANGNGDKTVAAAKDTELIDTIAYIGLDTSRWYVFEGTLMLKDSGDPLVENGMPVTVMSEPFKSVRADGTAKVRFIIDTTELDGKELVAFENCYRLNEFKKGDDVSKARKTLVADHKDINDGNQTVKISEAVKSIPPKTGDDTHLKLWLALMLGAIAAGTSLAVKETVERHRQRKEDKELFAR